jgi:D-aminopeptidase
MPRIRELGIYESVLPPGKLNAITDVNGVSVGHYTLIKGDGAWQPGRGPYRTGVTIIKPHSGNLYAKRVPAMVHTINGFGKVFGFEQVRELGYLESPIALTGTLNVPRVADALITLALEKNPHIGIGHEGQGRQGYASVNPLVGETSDGYLSDIHGRPIGLTEVRHAMSQATKGDVDEGAVGAGTGTSCFGWKGGIGTASRVIPEEFGGFIVGALIQSNYGQPSEITIDGLPLGRHLQSPDSKGPSSAGSIMIVLATDAPLNGRQLGRLCRRATFGLARTGSTCHGGSGDFVIAFSTAGLIPEIQNGFVHMDKAIMNEQIMINKLGLAVIEAVEEAIYNSLFMAESMIGRDGNRRYKLPVAEVLEIAKKYGRGVS